MEFCYYLASGIAEHIEVAGRADDIYDQIVKGKPTKKREGLDYFDRGAWTDHCYVAEERTT